MKPEIEKTLLTKEEFFKLHEDFFGEGSGSCSEIDDTDLCYRVAKAQAEKSYQAGETAGRGELTVKALEELTEKFIDTDSAG